MSTVDPSTLTIADIKKWDGTEMRKQMAHSETRAKIVELLAGLSRQDVEKIAAEQEAAAAAAAAQQPIVEKTPEEVAAEAEAEAARLQAEAAERLRQEEAAKPKKFAVDYQVKDEDGNPIGRPTHLEATTEEELRNKLIEAHTQATRAFHRLKKQKVSFKEQQQPAAPAQITNEQLLAAIEDAKGDDPKKVLEAQRIVLEAERAKLAQERENARQLQVSYAFIAKHVADYNNCEANNKLMFDYLVENNLQWTSDNLEIALQALESELAPVARPAAVVEVANPPVTPVQQQQPAAQPVQQVVTAPNPPAVAANPTPAAPRAGVNSGIIPGQTTSGVRPQVSKSAPKLTVEEMKSWDGKTMRMKMQNPAIRAEIEALAATLKSKHRSA